MRVRLWLLELFCYNGGRLAILLSGVKKKRRDLRIAAEKEYYADLGAGEGKG